MSQTPLKLVSQISFRIVSTYWCPRISGGDSCIFFILIVFPSGCLRLFSNLVVTELIIIHRKNYKLDTDVVISNRSSILTAKEIMVMIITIVRTPPIIIKILFV